MTPRQRGASAGAGGSAESGGQARAEHAASSMTIFWFSPEVFERQLLVMSDDWQPPYHERLDLYRISKDFAVELYRETAGFPASERCGLVAQIRRAAVSIPANIAEGAARDSKKDFARFLGIARGSANELRVLLEISARTGCLSDAQYRRCETVVNRISSMTSGLKRSVGAS